jgi:hypothetical protein
MVFYCTPVSSTNKTDCHDITEILLKVQLNTITSYTDTSCFKNKRDFFSEFIVHDSIMHNNIQYEENKNCRESPLSNIAN